MGSRVLNADGKEVTPIMGCYGIGIERILTAAIESSAAANAALTAHDSKLPTEQSKPAADPAYALPASIAPFAVVVTVTNVREARLARRRRKSRRSARRCGHRHLD